MSLLWRVKRSWPGDDVVLYSIRRHKCREEGKCGGGSGPYWPRDRDPAKSLVRGDVRPNVSIPRPMIVDIA